MNAPSMQGIRTEQATIRVLPDDVKSRIAAGEVIERPASVLKELVENALDADARQIHVALRDGGCSLIRVADDGHGMNRTDLELSIERHATSKLRSADDLFSLATLGFRGEALPSICSIAKASLLSRTAHESSAWRLTVNGGFADPVIPAAGPVGTTIEIRELFYNLPARKKFLKSVGSEAANCVDTLLRLALVRPDVSFALQHGKQPIFTAPAWQLDSKTTLGPHVLPGLAGPATLPVEAYVARAKAVLGKEIAGELVPVFAEGPDAQAGEGPGYRLFGLVSPPSKARPNRSSIYLAVNGRPVKDRTLTTAFINAYRHLLPPLRYPAGVLYLLVPGPEVDINVHPTKAEVRFRTPGLIFSLLHHAIREAFAAPRLASKPTIPELVLENSPPPRQTTFDLWSGAREVAMPTPERVSFTSTRVAPDRPDFSGKTERKISVSPTIEQVDVVFDTPTQQIAEAMPAFPQPASATQPPPPSSAPESWRIVGQAGGSYIVLEDESGIRLIDQHALHERILFENLMARARRQIQISRQGLLLPETIELTPVQAAVFAEPAAREVLDGLGYEVDYFGPRTVAVRAVPALVRSPKAASFVPEILEVLGSLQERTQAERLDATLLYEKAAYILSCKGAIKAGERLTYEQMKTLMEEFYRQLGSLQFTCPHGRPIAVELGWDELERKVGRR